MNASTVVMIVKEKIIMELDMVVINSVSTNMDFYYLKIKKIRKIDCDEFYGDIFSQLKNKLNKEDNMKFKVGDKVRIIRDSSLCGKLEKYIGTIQEIESIVDGDGVPEYCLKGLEEKYSTMPRMYYFEDELELVEDNNAVNHPAHYQGKIEVIDFIEDHNLNFNLGNAVKYISRAGKKNEGTYVQDLKKAIWYLEREVNK